MDIPPRLVLFDGECVLCDRSVHWLVRLDREGVFRVAALQDPAVRQLPGFQPTLRSVVLVENGRFLDRSAAVLGIMHELPFPFPALASLGSLLPRALRDWFYDRVAQIRYRVFGRRDYCPKPSPELLERVWSGPDAH